ncbi:MAG: S9 family peptidase [Candidatus Wenzhouxiangella sp. M2_3B_020]
MSKHPFRSFIGLLLASSIVLLAGCEPSAAPAESESGAEARPPEATAPDDGAVSHDLADTVARMGALDRAYDGRFSPDGDRLLYISSETGLPQLFLVDVDGRNAERITEVDDQIRGVAWSPDGSTLAVSLAPGGGLNTQIFLRPLEGGEMQRITEGGRTNNWLGDWSDDGRYLAYSSNRAGDGSVDAWLYDVENGESTMIADNPGIGTVQDLSPDSRRAVIWRMRSRGDTNLYLVEIETGEEQLLTAHEGVAVSQDAHFVGDSRIIFASNVDREMTALAEVRIDEDGRASPMRYIAERDDAELGGIEISDAGGEAVLNWNKAGKSELAFLDLESGEMRAGPDLPAEIASLGEYGPEGRLLTLTVSGSGQPTNVWLLNRESGEFTRVTETDPRGIDFDSLVTPELVRYEAHDGLELTGWLYRPRRVGEPAPYVLDFHGGPEGQERPSFNSTIQALLSQGIGVFAPNVRGSSGFGKTFVNLDNGALRVNAVKDIKASADFLVEEGIADPDRLGIMGGSYGGYMVMAGLAEYPDLFAAGANLFGVVNFKTFFENTEPWMAAISTVEYGDPETEADMLRELSPIHKVDRVRAPTIVLHGANDTNVPVVEAEQVVNNLEERGIPVRYVLFPDEGHGWQKTENRVTSTVEIVKWFDGHLTSD